MLNQELHEYCSLSNQSSRYTQISIQLLFNKILDNSMSNKSPHQQERLSKYGQFLRLNNKVLCINSLLHQKSKNQFEQSQSHFLQPYYGSLPTKKQRIELSFVPPKYEINCTKITLCNDQTLRTKYKLRKLKKHSSLKRDPRTNQDLISQLIPLNSNKKVNIFQAERELIASHKQSALLGPQHHEIIKKQLKDKFYKTHLSFKIKQQEESSHDLEKIQQKRSPPLKKNNKSQIVKVNGKQGDKFQPWAKSKSSRNQAFQFSDLAYNEEEYF